MSQPYGKIDVRVINPRNIKTAEEIMNEYYSAREKEGIIKIETYTDNLLELIKKKLNFPDGNT